MKCLGEIFAALFLPPWPHGATVREWLMGSVGFAVLLGSLTFVFYLLGY